MEKIMKTERHETFRRTIDKTLAGEVSLQEEKSLREHLQSCAPCQKYLSAETRVIASLNGFSFDVDPGLETKVCAALQLRAQQLEARQPSRQRWLWGCLIALLPQSSAPSSTCNLEALPPLSLAFSPRIYGKNY
jgi:anti-sigma factor RsiW